MAGRVGTMAGRVGTMAENGTAGAAENGTASGAGTMRGSGPRAGADGPIVRGRVKVRARPGMAQVRCCCCCLPCYHCSNLTLVNFLAYANRLHSTHCREFHYSNGLVSVNSLNLEI